MRFGIAYGLGAAIYAYRERLSFTVLGIPMIIGLASLLYKFQVFEVAMNVMLAYIVWCILQLVFMWMPNLSVTALLLISLPITFLLAHLSWHFVEKPMLKYKTGFSKYLRFGQKKPSYDAKAVLLD